jgi:hypothetical protein
MAIGRKKVATSVYLEPAQLEGLKALSRTAGGVPVAGLIRAAVDALLHPTPLEMIDALERASPGFCARLSPTQRDQLAHALVEAGAR